MLPEALTYVKWIPAVLVGGFAVLGGLHEGPGGALQGAWYGTLACLLLWLGAAVLKLLRFLASMLGDGIDYENLPDISKDDLPDVPIGDDINRWSDY